MANTSAAALAALTTSPDAWSAETFYLQLATRGETLKKLLKKSKIKDTCPWLLSLLNHNGPWTRAPKHAEVQGKGIMAGDTPLMACVRLGDL